MVSTIVIVAAHRRRDVRCWDEDWEPSRDSTLCPGSLIDNPSLVSMAWEGCVLGLGQMVVGMWKTGSEVSKSPLFPLLQY